MANNNLQVMRTQTAALKEALKLVHFDKILGMTSWCISSPPCSYGR